MNVLQTMEDVVTSVLTFLVIINVAAEVDTLWRKMVRAQVIPESCIHIYSYFIHIESVYELTSCFIL